MIRLSRRSSAAPASTTDSAGTQSRLKRWGGVAVEVTAIVTALTLCYGLVQGVIRPVLGKLRGHHGHLVVDSSLLTNGPQDSYVDGTGTVQTAASTPTLSLVLRNSGNAEVYIRTARIKVIDAADFDTCYTQGGGDVPKSNPVVIQLPVAPVLPTAVSVPVTKTVEPGEREAFPLLFGQRFNDAEWGLYLVQITLETDESPKSFGLGRYLLSVPGASAPDQSTFPVVPGMRPVDAPRFDLVSTWCYRYNLQRLQTLTALPGRRATETSDLSGTTQAADFDRHADPTPARQAAIELASAKNYAPVYAVFAAESINDTAFAASIRVKAVSTLLAGARSALADKFGSTQALELARAAHRLAPDEETNHVLADATRAALASTAAAAAAAAAH